MEPHALNLHLCFLTLHPKNIYIKKTTFLRKQLALCSHINNIKSLFLHTRQGLLHFLRMVEKFKVKAISIRFSEESTGLQKYSQIDCLPSLEK